MYNGIVVINKSQGMTSHDVVEQARRILRMRRVGHAGTLDPLATGVLVLLLGQSTKSFNRFLRFDKEYRAVLLLGTKTSTGDIEGKVLDTAAYEGITEDALREAFSRHTGQIQQVPPMVSAIKYKGRKLYELARKGIEVERAPRTIRVDELRLLAFDPPRIEFVLVCSSGTYVRTLAEDIARELGTFGCVERLERTRVGPFDIRDAVTLDALSADSIRQERGLLC